MLLLGGGLPPKTSWRSAAYLSTYELWKEPLQAELLSASDHTRRQWRAGREAGPSPTSRSRPCPAPLSRKPYQKLSDIGLRQLLYALRSEVRIQSHMEGQVAGSSTTTTGTTRT
jgi:hypothetical protein